MKNEWQGAPTVAVGYIDPGHVLLVRNPELVAVFMELHSRLKIAESCHDLTRALGSASQQPAAAGQPAANEPDLPEARFKSYPQSCPHGDN
jgi:hypothetical protein